MLDTNRHKFLLTRILKDIYADVEVAASLGFKGGTALMFFYDLPRFSVDLDFNLIQKQKEEAVYGKIEQILLKYGTIHDKAQKFHDPLLVLDYGKGERKLKVEISNRFFGDRYELKNLLGINMNVMVKPDMFAHKLCALSSRKSIANRDIFDCWFFMEQQTPINKSIVEKRMKMPLEAYFQKCVDILNA
jgi:predicted nucleotidyltransferase component of viral defense system